MHAIAANELKIRGVTALEDGLQNESEAVITVRGKNQYVVMRLEQYHHLREMELEAALFEVRGDLANGNLVRESPEAHLNRVTGE